MSRLAFQAYLTSCKSFEKLKISFGRDTKQKFAWEESTSEKEAYEKVPGQCQKVKLIRYRKGNVLTICVCQAYGTYSIGKGEGEERRGRKAKDTEEGKKVVAKGNSLSLRWNKNAQGFQCCMSKTLYITLWHKLRVFFLMYILDEIY